MPETTDHLLDVREVARRLGICRASLYNRLKADELQAIKIGSRTLFRTSEIDRYINDQPTIGRKTRSVH